MQLGEVDRDVISLREAAPAGDVDDARHGPEPAVNHPILQRLEISQAEAMRTLQTIAVDFPGWAFGRDRGCNAAGQRRKLREAIQHLLLRLVIGIIVGELHFHVRQPKQRHGPHRGDMLDAGELDFQRNRDVALDFLGRLAGPLRHHIDERRYRIRIGFDVEIGETDAAGREDRREKHEDEDAAPQRESE